MKTFHSLSPRFRIAATSRELTTIMSLLQVYFGCAFKNLLIQQEENVLFIEHIMPGSLYACSYDEWYFGVANYISVENYDVNIKLFQPNGPAAQFFKHILEGTCWIPIHDITTKNILYHIEALVEFTALTVKR